VDCGGFGIYGAGHEVRQRLPSQHKVRNGVISGGKYSESDANGN